MIFSIIFILLIIFGVGLPLSLWIAPKGNLVGRFGLSFLLGTGLFTLLMYFGNLLGLKFILVNNIFLLILFSAPLLITQKSRIRNYFICLFRSYRNTHFTPLEKIMLLVLGFLIISSFINTFYWPVYSWDSLTLYDFRGKIFAQTGFIKNAMIGGYYMSYPLLNSLSHTIIYLSGGNNPQFIYSIFYISLGLCFYGLLREFISRRLSLLFTFILLTVPLIFEHSLISYTNLPYTAFLSLGAIYFYVWYKKRVQGYLIFSAIFVGLSAWTRFVEPYWLGVFAVVFLTSALRKKFIDIIIYSLFLFPIQRAWGLYHVSLSNTIGSVTGGAGGYVKILTNIFDINRWIQVINFLYQNVVQPWGVVFIVFVFAFIILLVIKKQTDPILIFFITFALLSFLLVGTFIYSFTASNWLQLGDAVNRTSMIFYPLFIYCTALATINL